MSGAEVAVRVGSRVVRIEVEQAIVVVAVIVAADIQGIGTRVRVHGQQKPARSAQEIPKELYYRKAKYVAFGRK